MALAGVWHSGAVNREAAWSANSMMLHPMCVIACACVQIVRLVRIIKMFRLIKLLRMARLLKLPEVVGRLEAAIGRPTLQLTTMVAAVCLLLHWLACLWYLVAVIVDDTDNWVVAGGLVSCLRVLSKGTTLQSKQGMNSSGPQHMHGRIKA